MVKHARMSNSGPCHTSRPSEHRKGMVLPKPKKNWRKDWVKGAQPQPKLQSGRRERGDKYLNPCHFLHLPSPLLPLPPPGQNQQEPKEQGNTNNGVLEVSLRERRDEQRLDLEEQRRTRTGRERFCYLKDLCHIDGHLGRPGLIHFGLNSESSLLKSQQRYSQKLTSLESPVQELAALEPQHSSSHCPNHFFPGQT